MITKSSRVTVVVVVVAVLAVLATSTELVSAASKKKTLTLTSTAFANGGTIPVEFTCRGDGKSPDLSWKNVPSGTKQFALIMEDPDTAIGTFVHWVLAEMAAKTRSIPEDTEPADAYGGTNGAGRPGWIPPCPPSGVHRYIFTLYALSRKLSLPPGATAATLRGAMKGKVLARAQLLGRYGS
jgi:Raf kinase inhibitor-like YbhB/YbcL family protein